MKNLTGFYVFSIFGFAECSAFGLEFLIHMRSVQDIRGLHTVAKQIDFRRLIVEFGRHVPELENMEALLGADADADD